MSARPSILDHVLDALTTRPASLAVINKRLDNKFGKGATTCALMMLEKHGLAILVQDNPKMLARWRRANADELVSRCRVVALEVVVDYGTPTGTLMDKIREIGFVREVTTK